MSFKTLRHLPETVKEKGAAHYREGRGKVGGQLVQWRDYGREELAGKAGSKVPK